MHGYKKVCINNHYCLKDAQGRPLGASKRGGRLLMGLTGKKKKLFRGKCEYNTFQGRRK